jgi:hypothetical protein
LNNCASSTNSAVMTLERLVVFDARVLAIRVLPCIPVRLIGRHASGYLTGDALLHALRIGKQTTKLLVERLHDAGQPIQFRLRFGTATGGRHRFDLGLGIGQSDRQRGLFSAR